MPSHLSRLACVMTALLALACDSASTSPAPAATVSLGPATSTIEIGATVQLQASVQNAAGVTWSSTPGGIVTISPSGLVTGLSGGTAQVTATAIGDPDVAATVSVTVLSAAPDIASFAPTSGQANVSIEASITVTFAEPIAAGSIPSDAIRVIDMFQQPVSGSVSYDAGTRTLTFVPSSPLSDEETTHTVTVTGVVNPEGRPMAAPVSWSFSTEFVSENFYYRIANYALGDPFTLDNYSGQPNCHMATTASNTTGSWWYFERAPTGESTYLLKSQFGGPNLALEAADGVSPCLLTGVAPAGFVYSGQVWSFPTFPGTIQLYRMQALSFGAAKSLDVFADGRNPEEAVMRDNTASLSQAWALIRLPLRR